MSVDGLDAEDIAGLFGNPDKGSSSESSTSTSKPESDDDATMRAPTSQPTTTTSGARKAASSTALKPEASASASRASSTSTPTGKTSAKKAAENYAPKRQQRDMMAKIDANFKAIKEGTKVKAYQPKEVHPGNDTMWKIINAQQAVEDVTELTARQKIIQGTTKILIDAKGNLDTILEKFDALLRSRCPDYFSVLNDPSKEISASKESSPDTSTPKPSMQEPSTQKSSTQKSSTQKSSTQKSSTQKSSTQKSSTQKSQGSKKRKAVKEEEEEEEDEEDEEEPWAPSNLPTPSKKPKKAKKRLSTQDSSAAQRHSSVLQDFETENEPSGRNVSLHSTFNKHAVGQTIPMANIYALAAQAEKERMEQAVKPRSLQPPGQAQSLNPSPLRQSTGDRAILPPLTGRARYAFAADSQEVSSTPQNDDKTAGLSKHSSVLDKLTANPKLSDKERDKINAKAAVDSSIARNSRRREEIEAGRRNMAAAQVFASGFRSQPATSISTPFEPWRLYGCYSNYVSAGVQTTLTTSPSIAAFNHNIVHQRVVQWPNQAAQVLDADKKRADDYQQSQVERFEGMMRKFNIRLKINELQMQLDD